MNIIEFADKIKTLNGNTYLVGGAVRDCLLNKPCKDNDYVVCGITENDFLNLFPFAEKVGKSFPVFLVDIEGEKCEVAFARKEKKIANGYKGFEITFTPNITIEEDLYRRDLTINSIAIDVLTGEVIDPFNGIDDIKNKILRPTSKYFMDDPVRTLRIARFATLLNFDIVDYAYNYMYETKEELKNEPQERIFNELLKILNSKKPSVFFEHLKKANVLDVTFPHIYNLIGKTQPVKFHPEGDAFNHTMNIIDEVAKHTSNTLVRFCALTHDIGKSVTPLEMLPHHYGHDNKGKEIMDLWNKKMTLPKHFLQASKFVCENHMKMINLKKVSKITKFFMDYLRIRHLLSIEEFNIIIKADSGELPIFLIRANEILNIMNEKEIIPSDKVGKQIADYIFVQKQKKINNLLK